MAIGKESCLVVVQIGGNWIGEGARPLNSGLSRDGWIWFKDYPC